MDRMIETKLEVIRRIKDEAGTALAHALDRLGGQHYSESHLADTWLAELRHNPTFYEDGWYSPPPHGVISLFGKPADRFERICQPSFRPQSMWSMPDIYYDREDVIALYASPIHRPTHLIGDFGLTLYRGGNPELAAHCEKVLATTLAIARNTNPGMSFKSIYNMAMDMGQSVGLTNSMASIADKTGTNIGHTIPLSYASDPTHGMVGKAQNFDDLCWTLSAGRKFVNAQELQRVEDNMAFTIEPRFSSSKMPNIWFHLTVVFENGVQSICHGFKPIMQRFSMNSLLAMLQD